MKPKKDQTKKSGRNKKKRQNKIKSNKKPKKANNKRLDEKDEENGREILQCAQCSNRRTRCVPSPAWTRVAPTNLSQTNRISAKMNRMSDDIERKRKQKMPTTSASSTKCARCRPYADDVAGDGRPARQDLSGVR